MFDSNFFSFWFIMLILFFHFLGSSFFNFSLGTYFLNFTVNFLESFFQSNKTKNFSKSSQFIFVSLMLVIFILNFVSLLPFTFSPTAQVSIVLSMSLIFWSMTFICYSFLNFKGFFSHCIPEGAPLVLIFFLFLIELVSNFIRPITLMVRLSANIVAGHVIMHLLFDLMNSFFYFFPFYVFINLLEIFVCFIQAWIFCTLLSLYYAEMN